MAPVETVTPKGTESVWFSKTMNLRLVKAPLLRGVSALGTQQTHSPGFRVEFQDGYLTVDDKLRAEHDRFMERYAEKYDAAYEDQSLDDWLRGHEGFGSLFVEIKSMVQPSGPALERVVELLTLRDEAGLAELYEAETAGDGREDVLRACVQALNAMEAERAALEASGAPGGS